MSKQSLYNKRRRHQKSIYSDLPFDERRLNLTGFAAWVQGRGGTCLATTNQYEVARWRDAAGNVAVLYKNAQEELTWTISAAEDYRAFSKENTA